MQSTDFKPVSLKHRAFINEVEAMWITGFTRELLVAEMNKPERTKALYQIGRRRRYHKNHFLAAFDMKEEDAERIINRKLLERHNNEQYT